MSSIPQVSGSTASIPAPAQPTVEPQRDSDGDHDGSRPATADTVTISPQAQAALATAAPVDDLSRKVAALHKQGMSAADIAQRLGKTESQVKAALAAQTHH